MAHAGAQSAVDRLAFEAAVRSESRKLYGLAYSVLRDAGEAEDAVQETMELAWRFWKSVREPERRNAWLRQICLRRCLRLQRRLRDRWPLGEALPAREPAGIEAHDLDLERAFLRLSLQQRAVVALHYHYGYSLDECAALMSCRPGTVRSHLGRALTRLRKELRDG
jgi:RNA polymerase sigma-70 factor (ECF subfamily)